MEVMHTILREDFGRLDRRLVRSMLLMESGIRNVSFEGDNGVPTAVYLVLLAQSEDDDAGPFGEVAQQGEMVSTRTCGQSSARLKKICVPLP